MGRTLSFDEAVQLLDQWKDGSMDTTHANFNRIFPQLGTPSPSVIGNLQFGSNNTRYRNAEYDALLDLYLVTIPMAERIESLGQVIYHIADQLPEMGLYYRVQPTMVAKRVTGAGARHVNGTEAWNVHEWDAK